MPYVDIYPIDEPTLGFMINYDGEDAYLAIDLLIFHFEIGISFSERSEDNVD